MTHMLAFDSSPLLAVAAGHFLVKLLAKANNFWGVVGLCGGFVFSLRFVIQWIASERARKSIIPFGFWECSVLGSFLLLGHFIAEKDLAGILQSALPLPIYLRNVYLRALHKTPKHPGNEPRPAE